jgi:5'-methylthioadenosine phosphorylase
MKRLKKARFSMQQPLIGVMGGSGLYRMEALENPIEHKLMTPFGAPSDILISGTIAGVPVAFLARHGRGHTLLPSERPFRANIHAFKQLGVKYLLSVSAVGSLREDYRPLDMVLPDQYIDLTKKRESTFFGQGAVAHVSMAEPVCAKLTDILERAWVESGGQTESLEQPILHRGGTYVCIEGPQFSSIAESHWYRSMGASVIGMTNMPEAKLAREAQIAYASLAMVTDFDCWHPREANVTAESAIANLMKNAETAQRILIQAITLIGKERPDSDAHRALASALVTQPVDMSPDVFERLRVILD